MSYLTVLNKNAGGYSKKRRTVEEIHRILSLGTTRRTITTASVSDLEDFLEKNKDFQPDVLGIGGGDGTITRTLTSIYKKFGFIPEFVALYVLGTMNNTAKALGIGEIKPEEYAEYVAKTPLSKLETKPLGIFDVNGAKGFSVGFGIVPKLLWLYYGRSVKQYQRLEKELQECDESEYETTFKRIFDEPRLIKDLIDIITRGKRSGNVRAVTTGLAAILSAFKRDSEKSRFFDQPLEGDIFIDGRKQDFPEQPRGIYTASYPEIHMGMPFNPKPVPEADAAPKKMRVVVTWGKPFEILTQVPKIFLGQHMKNTRYSYASELVYVPKAGDSCQIDGEFILGNEFTVTKKKKVKIITPRPT